MIPQCFGSSEFGVVVLPCYKIVRSSKLPFLGDSEKGERRQVSPVPSYVCSFFYYYSRDECLRKWGESPRES